MAYEKMLANDAASKQKVVAVKERQARELAARGQREAAIEVVQQKQEAQTSLAEIEGRLEEARKNSEEMERAFREQERRYNDVALERARQAIRQSSYEAQAVGELGTSETERQIAAAEVDIKRLDAERELEMMELQMGLRDAESLEAAPSERVDEEVTAEEPSEAQPEGEERS